MLKQAWINSNKTQQKGLVNNKKGAELPQHVYQILTYSANFCKIQK